MAGTLDHFSNNIVYFYLKIQLGMKIRLAKLVRCLFYERGIWFLHKWDCVVVLMSRFRVCKSSNFCIILNISLVQSNEYPI